MKLILARMYERLGSEGWSVFCLWWDSKEKDKPSLSIRAVMGAVEILRLLITSLIPLLAMNALMLGEWGKELMRSKLKSTYDSIINKVGSGVLIQFNTFNFFFD